MCRDAIKGLEILAEMTNHIGSGNDFQIIKETTRILKTIVEDEEEYVVFPTNTAGEAMLLALLCKRWSSRTKGTTRCSS